MELLTDCSAFMKKNKQKQTLYSIHIDDGEYKMAYDDVKLICSGDVFGDDIGNVDAPEHYKEYVLHFIKQGMEDEECYKFNRGCYMIFEGKSSNEQPILIPIFIHGLDIDIKIRAKETNDSFTTANYSLIS